jgi:hypothetical protein
MILIAFMHGLAGSELLCKAKDPRAVKRSKGPSVIASTIRLLSLSGVGGRRMGKAAQIG